MIEKLIRSLLSKQVMYQILSQYLENCGLYAEYQKTIWKDGQTDSNRLMQKVILNQSV